MYIPVGKLARQHLLKATKSCHFAPLGFNKALIKTALIALATMLSLSLRGKERLGVPGGVDLVAKSLLPRGDHCDKSRHVCGLVAFGELEKIDRIGEPILPQAGGR